MPERELRLELQVSKAYKNGIISAELAKTLIRNIDEIKALRHTADTKEMAIWRVLRRR